MSRNWVGPVNKPGTSAYASVHMWVRRWYGAATECEVCGETERVIDWANISGEYRRDISDFVELCRPCHRRWDGSDSPRKSACKRGHPFSSDNIVMVNRWNRTPERACRKCRKMFNDITNGKKSFYRKLKREGALA